MTFRITLLITRVRVVARIVLLSLLRCGTLIIRLLGVFVLTAIRSRLRRVLRFCRLVIRFFPLGMIVIRFPRLILRVVSRPKRFRVSLVLFGLLMKLSTLLRVLLVLVPLERLVRVVLFLTRLGSCINLVRRFRVVVNRKRLRLLRSRIWMRKMRLRLNNLRKYESYVVQAVRSPPPGHIPAQ